MMTKREVVKTAIEHKKPPYVPWQLYFTLEAYQKLQKHFSCTDLTSILDNHIMFAGNSVRQENLGNDLWRDVFGVVWDKSKDKDIGVIKGCLIHEPDMGLYKFPYPTAERFFADIPEAIEKHGDCFRAFAIGFSLFERAWTLRGMENLMMDFLENPEFVHELLTAIADYNIAQVEKAVTYDFDCIYFGDDWGQQHGLIMGPKLWKEFIYPQLKRMYGVVKAAGKKVLIHSCGDVDELFDDLVGIGLDCFNPFQPEVMDVDSLMAKYKGKLAFYGGLSTQKTLPYGSEEDVRRECRHLIDMGRNGGYIFAAAHSVEGDVPLENLLAFIEEAHHQKKNL